MLLQIRFVRCHDVRQKFNITLCGFSWTCLSAIALPSLFSLTLDIGREEETKSIVYETSAFTHMRITTPFPILGAWMLENLTHRTIIAKPRTAWGGYCR